MMSAADLTPAAAAAPAPAVAAPAAAHVHGPWVIPERGKPLVCQGCGELWPAAPLPEPAHHRAGYDGVADGPGFAARLRTALSEVDRDA
jgi:hypothetical protein